MEASFPLPAPFKRFEENDALFYRGAVTLLAGPPGSGKTISSLNFVNRLKVPTLYVSNDSTRYTVINRVFSMLTGREMAVSKEIIENNPELASIQLQRWSQVRFDFNSKPDVSEIVNHGEAFRELFGEYPHLTVVDILMNIDHEGVAEQNYWRLMPALKEIASEQNTALLAVHHTSESAKGEPCPPMSAIMGKANQLPELIITQVMVGNKMYYAVVKNRNGPSDPSGKRSFTLPVDASRFTIEDAPDEVDIIFRDGTITAKSDKIGVSNDDEEEF